MYGGPPLQKKYSLDLSKAFEIIPEKKYPAHNPDLKVVDLVHDGVDLFLSGQQVESDALVVGQ